MINNNNNRPYKIGAMFQHAEDNDLMILVAEQQRSLISESHYTFYNIMLQKYETYWVEETIDGGDIRYCLYNVERAIFEHGWTPELIRDCCDILVDV